MKNQKLTATFFVTSHFNGSTFDSYRIHDDKITLYQYKRSKNKKWM